MKTPPDLTDPLLQSLADEAADLPLYAANEARLTRARQLRRRQQFALTVAVLFCGVCAWQAIKPPTARRENVAMQSSPTDPASWSEQPDEPSVKPAPGLSPKLAPDPEGVAETPAPTLTHVPAPLGTAPLQKPSIPPDAEPRAYVKVQTEEEAMNNPLPIPDGLSKEQQAVVEAARGLPLLFVRDSTGKITRIHIIER